MQLAIAQNPYAKDPTELWNILKESETKKPKRVVEAKFDAAGFERLKAIMGQNPKFQIKS